MPTDSIIDNLYVLDAETGEKYKLGHIEDIELTASDSQDAESNLRPNYTESFSVSVPFNVMRLLYQLYVMTGNKFRVPNNWLKRHKIPMNRRKAYYDAMRIIENHTKKGEQDEA